MKIVIALNGSPHEQGSTVALADAVLKSAAGNGAKIRSYYLNGMHITGCQGCRTCGTTGCCVQKDDMQLIYNDIADADGIIFATPVYMWQMSAQLKTVVDRLLPFLRRNNEKSPISGKKVLIAATQGRPDTSLFRSYFEHMGKNLLFIGFSEYRILIAGGTQKPEDLLSQTEVMAEAEKMGNWLTE